MNPTAAALCDEIGIRVVPPGRRSALCDLETCAERTIEKMVERHGVAHARFVLRTIAETVNNRRELVAPTIEAVSDVALAHPAWAERAGDWLDAFDLLDLPALRSQARTNLRAVAVRDAMAALIHDRLLHHLGSERLL
jgi:hypothetical protein